MNESERKALAQEYRELDDTISHIMHQIDDVYLPLVDEVLANGDVKTATELMHELPHCVPKVFIADRIRQHQKEKSCQ